MIERLMAIQPKASQAAIEVSEAESGSTERVVILPNGLIVQKAEQSTRSTSSEGGFDSNDPGQQQAAQNLADEFVASSAISKPRKNRSKSAESFNTSDTLVKEDSVREEITVGAKAFVPVENQVTVVTNLPGGEIPPIDAAVPWYATAA